MPIPDKPYTRKEAYLNAAATGDSSGIPETPYTREEMYLDAIAKGGGGGGGGGSSTLSGLTDVDISNPTNGQVLVYNAATGRWENGEGGGTLIVHQSHDEVHGIYTLDKTWQELYDAIQVGPVLLVTEDETNEDGFSSSLLQSVSMDAGSYWVNFANGSFDADSANGYPYYQAG